jgi:predicted permease
MSNFIQDVRFALRLLVKDRSFTVTALLTLAVCIAANTAMFSIVRSVLLKPLPFPDSERIVLLYNSCPNAGAPRVGAAVPDYFDRVTAAPALDEQALFRTEGMTLGDANGAERLTSFRAMPAFFRMVRIQPIAGRIFTEEEGETGKNTKVLLSYGFCLRKFGDTGSAVGKTLRLNGNQFDIVGVMPRSFTFLKNDIDIYTPAAFNADSKADNQRHSNNWQMVGHLKAGATIDQVRQQVDALNAQNDTRFPEFRQILKDARFHTVAVFLHDDLVRDVKTVLYLLWGGVVFVLIIGCVNIANLVMVRASARQREMATRHAIGGDLGRLARQLFTETTMLAVSGGAMGVLLGWWGIRSLAAMSLDQLPRGYEISLDPVVVAVIGGITLAVGVLLGIAPVLRLWRMNLNAELREETRGGTASRRANIVRRVLATTQVAIALVLLVGAGLLLASFRAIMHVDVGFEPDQVFTATMNLAGSTYREDAALVTFKTRAMEAIRALPNVTGAGMTTNVPFSGNVNNNVIMAEGYVMKPGESLLAPTQSIASDGYFESMRIPLAKGRYFDARDTKDATQVVIIDERLANKFWPDRDPIGRRLYQPSDAKDLQKITKDTKFFLIVGVVKDVQFADPSADFTPVGTFYFPYDQQPQRGFVFTVKTRGAPGTIGNAMRQAVAAIEPAAPLFRMQPMQDYIDKARTDRRAFMSIAVAFGLVALFLSALGIYGVLAYSVSERRRELGVRMALGGSTASVFALILRDGGRIVGIGLAAGLAGAAGLGQLMKSVLFGVTPLSPVVLTLVTLILLVVAFIATTIPAWRASRIDPIVALGR